MARRHFYSIPDGVKYRLVFENSETVYGVNDKHEYRLFGKDTGRISFSKREALKAYVKAFVEKEFVEKQESSVEIPALT